MILEFHIHGGNKGSNVCVLVYQSKTGIHRVLLSFFFIPITIPAFETWISRHMILKA